MHHIGYLFLSYLTSTEPLGYILIVIGMFFEGDASLFATAFLTREGVFDPIYAFLAVFGGVIIGDLCWYYIGSKIASKFKRFHDWVFKFSKPFDSKLLEHPFKTIFISKYTYGLHHAILVRSGMLGISIKKFIKIDIISSLVWILVIGGLGFFFSFALPKIRYYIKFAEVSLILAIVVLFLIKYIIDKYAKKKI